MKTPKLPAPTRAETRRGFAYFAFQLLILPTLLTWANSQLSTPVSEAELNFLYYFLNFLAVSLMFHTFLGANGRQLLSHPIAWLQAVILGFVGYWLTTQAISLLIAQCFPHYANQNDSAVLALSRDNFFLTALGIVFLVPLAEECFFRGLIFRNLYASSHWAAYAVSALAFCGLHIAGYLGSYSALELLIALAQYLPAGLFLAWSYAKSGTILAPVAIHALVNAITLFSMR